MQHLREKAICVIREFDFRGDGEKICPYHSPCLTESIIMCIYVLCDSHSHLSCREGGGGGGRTPYFAKIGIYCSQIKKKIFLHNPFVGHCMYSLGRIYMLITSGSLRVKQHDVIHCHLNFTQVRNIVDISIPCKFVQTAAC